MLVNVHILCLFSHCVSFVLLTIDFIVILHVRLIRVLLKINHVHAFCRPISFCCVRINAMWQLKENDNGMHTVVGFVIKVINK